MSLRFASLFGGFLLAPAMVFAQPCLWVPEDASENRILFEGGELSLYCFERLEELYLRPVNPGHNEWHRFAELGIVFERSDIPSKREMLRFAPFSDSLKDAFYDAYPKLRYLNPLILWPPQFDSATVQGSASASFRARPYDESITADVGGGISHSRGGNAALVVRAREESFFLYERVIGLSGIPRLSIVAGNGTPERNPLLWGRYEPLRYMRGAENVLYGYKQGWNGLLISYGTQQGMVSFNYHQREMERLFHGGGGRQIANGLWQVGAEVAFEEREVSSLLGQVRIAHIASGVQLLCAVDFDGAFAFDISFERFQKNGGFLGSLFFLSPRYDAPLSSSVYALQRIERGEEIGIGIDVRSYYRIAPFFTARLELFSLLSEDHFLGDGIVVLNGGRQVRARSRSRVRVVDTAEGILFSQVVACKVPLHIWTPEIIGYGEWKAGEWQESSVTAKISFRYREKSSVSLAYMATWKATQTKQIVFVSLRQVLRDKMRGGVRAELPLTASLREVRLYGELFFEW